MNEEKKQGNKIKIAIAVVLILAIIVGIGIYVASRMNGNYEPTNDDIVTQVPGDPEEPVEPGEPTIEPEVPEQEPEPEPDEPDIPDEPDVPDEPEPEPTPEPEPEPEPEEPAQEREDMIFFEDTGEFNAEGFHKALMYIMENYESLGMTLEEIFYGRLYNDYNFFAVNWNEEDNNIYMFSNCELKNSTNGNDKEINITSLNNIDLRSAEYGNSIEKFVDKIMNNDRISINNVYRLAYHHTEDDLDSLEDYYTKAYQMAEHRIEQELNRNEIVIGSFIEARKSMPAGNNLGNYDEIITHYWCFNERTNELSEHEIAVDSSVVLGGGFEKNLYDCSITGSNYVKVFHDNEGKIIDIEPETLYNVENSKVINTKSSVKTDKYAFVVDNKYYKL